MGLLGFLSFLVKYIIYSLIAALIFVLIPDLPPHMHFGSYSASPAFKLEGKLSPSNVLDKAEVITHELFSGCESAVVEIDKNGEEIVYTGTITGKILKYREKTGEVSVLAETGINLDGKFIPTRPLGMRLTRNHLWVADAGMGIIKVDTRTGQIEPVFPITDPIEGQPPNFSNDLDVGKDGSIYWSDVSTNLNGKTFMIEILGNVPSGRLVQYDPKTGKNKVLIKGIHVANGVQLSENEDFVLVAELIRCKILRYYLKGPKAGTHDVFLDGLPGIPDNIRASGRGTFYVSLVGNRRVFPDFLGPLPLLRKLILRTTLLIENVLFYLNINLPTSLLKFTNAQWVVDLTHMNGLVLEVDEQGKVVQILQSSNGQVVQVSQFTPSKNYAYISSPFGTKMWKLPMAQLN